MFLLAPAPNDAHRETFDFLGLVHRAAGAPVEADFGFWDLRVSIARDYQVGRGFIAGDAAHSHPPFGGFGPNNGLEDIRNLGWKLSARLQGWGGDALLASYSEERRSICWEVGEDFIARRMEREGAFVDRSIAFLIHLAVINHNCRAFHSAELGGGRQQAAKCRLNPCGQVANRQVSLFGEHHLPSGEAT